MKKLLLLFLLTTLVYAEGIKDIINPVHLIAGETDTLLISDLFYSSDYNLRLINNPSINYIYYGNKYLVLKPADNFEGIGLLKFIKDNKTYAIPFNSQLKAKQVFRVKPGAQYNKVNLFGSFNSWNRESHVMNFNQEKNEYEITVLLDPGRYEYKFYADGVEFLDPTNNDSIPNGLGGYNSVISIKPFHSEPVFLHVIGKQKTSKGTNLSFYYEGKNSSINKTSVIALIDNSELPAEYIIIDDRKITLTLPVALLRGDPVIRVAINDQEQSTYFQTVRFYNGEVAANNNNSSYNNIIYAMMIDRFNDGDKSNSIPVKHPMLLDKANYFGGDLQGIINKINEGYFDSLGVNTLWLSPVIANTDSAYQEYPEPHRYYTGYHGYWPVNPTGVEERFGSMKLLKQLVITAHKHNMKVLLDYVANHIHIEHPWWKQHRDWFGQLELPDGTKNLRRWDEYRLTTWFEPFMPKFDFINSKEALEAMTDNAIWWLKNTGVDGFRHDAVKHVPNEYWRLLTKKLKKEFQGKKLIYQIGETFGSYELVNSYVNNGQLDAQFNFILYDTAIPTFTGKTSFSSLDEQMHRTFDVYGVNHLMGNIMDSHDKVRFMAYADNDVNDTTGNTTELGWSNPPEVDHASSYSKLKLYIVYLSAIPGVPVIYYGDEIGMTGAGDPDNRRMMRFQDQLRPLEKQTLSEIRQIVKIRDSHPALRYGDFLTLKADDKNYAFIRSDFNGRILVVLNKGEQASQYELNVPEFYNIKNVEDIINNTKYPVEGNTLRIKADGLSYKLFKLY